MEHLEQATQGVAGLHWPATLLTGCGEIAAGVTVLEIRCDQFKSVDQ